jgi:hypothetical protein
MSYCNDIGKNESGIREYPGFWDVNGNWHDEKVEAAKEILDSLLK